MVLSNTILATLKSGIKTNISTEMTHMDFGSGTTAVSASDTAMEVSIVRNARQDITTLSNDVIVSGFLGSGQGNGSTVTEIGVFDAASTATGVMQEHALITAIDKTAAKELWVDIRNNINITQE